MELKVAFEGTQKDKIEPVMKSAAIIIPYFKYSPNSDQGSYTVTVENTTVVSFAGMVQDLLNKTNGKASFSNEGGQQVNIKANPKYTHLELEKELKVFM